jgi:hypothetical protein
LPQCGGPETRPHDGNSLRLGQQAFFHEAQFAEASGQVLKRNPLGLVAIVPAILMVLVVKGKIRIGAFGHDLGRPL